MSYKPPSKILVTSDDSIMEYKRTIPKNKNIEEKYLYKFISSITKTGKEMEFTETELKKYLSNFFKEIK